MLFRSPFEERPELEEIAAANDIIIITLVSPVSEGRIGTIAKDAKGFIYCVSSLGVTGVRKDFDTDFGEFIASINKASSVPKAVGFGISSPQQAEEMKKYFDGVIVGSAIVKIVEESSNQDEAVNNVGRYVEELRNALDR